MNKLRIQNLALIVTERCNLNCAHCNHFTPLSEEKIFKIEDILEDFKRLKKVFDNIGKMVIYDLEVRKNKIVITNSEIIDNLPSAIQGVCVYKNKDEIYLYGLSNN